MQEFASADMYLLDVVADDIESFDHILERLNGDHARAWWRIRGAQFDREEVVECLSRLITRDFVRVYTPDPLDGRLVELPAGSLPPSEYSAAWFGITPRGLLVHGTWDEEGSPLEG
jgi:hypothetical protein